MIKAYSKAFQLQQAIDLYNQMMLDKASNPDCVPNNVTYNSLLDCCVRCFNMPQAEVIFKAMQDQGQANSVRPDLITYSTMIKGYCKEKNLE
jgi:pentatricopeptide repeat protein